MRHGWLASLLLVLIAPALARAEAPVLYSEALSLDSDAEIEIDLDDLAIEIEPLTAGSPDAEIDLGEATVLGNRSLFSVLDDARAVTVIDAADFGQTTTVLDVIERVPGVDVRRQGGLGQLGSVLVRGARSNQVLVLVDGQPLALDSTDLALLPLGRIERIEVLRGPAAAQFGPGALGGVLNLITEQEVDPGTATADTENDYIPLDANRHAIFGSALESDDAGSGSIKLTGGGYSATGIDLAYEADGTRYFLSHLGAQNNYDYTRNAGLAATRSNNDVSRQSFWVDWHDSGLSHRAGLTHLERGVPGPAEFPTRRARLRRDNLWWQSTGSGWRAAFSADLSRFTDPDPVLHSGEIDTRSMLLHLDLAAGSNAGAARDWGLNLRTDLSDSDSSGRHTRAGLDLHRTWSRSSGRLLATADAGLTASTDAAVDPLANIGLEYGLGRGARCYINAGYAVRHPSFSELYYADTGGVRGNPDLDPESVLNYEVGLAWSGKSAHCELAGFFSDYRDSIIWAPVSASAVEAINTGGAEVAGVEGLIDVMLADEWWWRSAATWLPHAEYDSGIPLTGRAESHVNSRLEYATAAWNGALSVDYTGEIPADLFGSLVIEPRTICGFELSHDDKGHVIGLSVTNLFDENARDSWDYPLPGREIYLTYAMEF